MADAKTHRARRRRRETAGEGQDRHLRRRRRARARPERRPRPARVPPGQVVRIFAPWVALLAVLAAYPFLVGGTWARAGSYIAVYALVALSLTLVTGWAGALSLGQAAFVGLGAFGAAYLTRAGVPVVAWFPAAVAASIPLSVVTGLATFRLPAPYFAVATLALNLAAGSLVFGPAEREGVTAVAAPPLAWLGLGEERTLFLIVLVVVAACFGAALRIGRGRTGRALFTVRDSATAALAAGIRPRYYRTLAFVVSGALAAIAGVLFALLEQDVTAAAFTPFTSIGYLAVAVVGGIASVLGAVLAGALYHLPVALGLGRGAAAPGDAPLALLVHSALFLAVVIGRPDGAAGLLRAGAARLGWTKGGSGRDLGPAGRRRPTSAPSATLAVAAVDKTPGALLAALGGLPAGVPERDVDGETAADPPILELRSVSVGGGAGRLLDGVSLRVEPGEIVGLVGPPRAGKTLLLDVCCGFRAPSAGRVILDGGDITAVAPAGRVRLGVLRTFQTPQLAAGLGVFENLLVGSHSQIRYGLPAEIVGFSYGVRDELAQRDRVHRLLEVVGLTGIAGCAAGALAPGHAKLVEVTRTLLAEPRILLLDDPAAGLAVAEREWLGDLVRAVADDLGVAVVITGDDSGFVAGLADHAYVLSGGRIAGAGRPGELLATESHIGDGRADQEPPRAPSARDG